MINIEWDMAKPLQTGLERLVFQAGQPTPTNDDQLKLQSWGVLGTRKAMACLFIDFISKPSAPPGGFNLAATNLTVVGNEESGFENVA